MSLVEVVNEKKEQNAFFRWLKSMVAILSNRCSFLKARIAKVQSVQVTTGFFQATVFECIVLYVIYITMLVILTFVHSVLLVYAVFITAMVAMVAVLVWMENHIHINKLI